MKNVILKKHGEKGKNIWWMFRNVFGALSEGKEPGRPHELAAKQND